MRAARTLPHCAQTKSSGPLPVHTGRSGASWSAVPPSGGTSPGRTRRIVTRAIASDLLQALREVGDQPVEHAHDDALAHRRRLAGDLRRRVDVAAAVVEREAHVGVRVALDQPAADRVPGELDAVAQA